LKWPALRHGARAFLSKPQASAFDSAVQWYENPAWEVLFFAVSVLGGLAAEDERALDFLREKCGSDHAWQVNEALAMAFDDYCAATSYEQALPEMRKWLASPRANVRRAVSEGLRPWTASKRAYFAR